MGITLILAAFAVLAAAVLVPGVGLVVGRRFGAGRGILAGLAVGLLVVASAVGGYVLLVAATFGM